MADKKLIREIKSLKYVVTTYTNDGTPWVGRTNDSMEDVIKKGFVTAYLADWYNKKKSRYEYKKSLPNFIIPMPGMKIKIQ